MNPGDLLIEHKHLPGTYGVGFHATTYDGLLIDIQSDPKIFTYYGSQTRPPCSEDVLWILTGEPRTVSSEQLEYIRNILQKERPPQQGEDGSNKQSGEGQVPSEQPGSSDDLEEDAVYPEVVLQGNKRNIVPYDATTRGRIQVNVAGIKNIANAPYMKIKIN